MSVQSLVMSRAAELREEGYDPSEALSLAWDEVRGEDNPELYENPAEELVLANPTRRRRNVANPSTRETVSWFTVALLALLAFTWWYKSAKGGWWWANLGKIKRLPMPARPMVTGGPQYAPLGKVKMDGLKPIYEAKNLSEESITWIDV